MCVKYVNESSLLISLDEEGMCIVSLLANSSKLVGTMGMKKILAKFNIIESKYQKKQETQLNDAKL